MKVSIILPTYNEKENIQKIIEAILSQARNAEIIVVDDNSPDGTWKIAEGMKRKNVSVIRRMNERGLASAVASGIKEAKGDMIMWLDADFSHPPEKIPELLEQLKQYDISKGSRFLKGAGDTRGFARKLTSLMFNKFATLMLSRKVTDWDTQFMAVRKEVLQNVRIRKATHGQYLVSFLHDCIRKGYRIKEVPFIFNDRKWGKSKTVSKWYSLIMHGWNYGIYVLKIKYKGN